MQIAFNGIAMEWLALLFVVACVAAGVSKSGIKAKPGKRRGYRHGYQTKSKSRSPTFTLENTPAPSRPSLPPNLAPRSGPYQSPVPTPGDASKADYGEAKFYLKRKTILTAREIECYQRLAKSLSPNFLVFPQVAYSQILEARGGTSSQNKWLFRTMCQKVADFLVCKSDLTMIAIIELDDSSHYGKEDQDKRRDAIVRQIGLMPLRIPRTPDQALFDRYADVLNRMHPPAAEAQTTRAANPLEQPVAAGE